MSKRVIHMLVDDLDGSEADETVQFGIDGAMYEIDLTEKNAGKLRDALAPFLAAGLRLGRATAGRQPVNGYRRTQLAPSGATQKQLNEQIREWAASEGIRVNERGRIKQAIVDAYQGRDSGQAEELLAAAYQATGMTPPAPATPPPPAAPRQRPAKKAPAFSG